MSRSANAHDFILRFPDGYATRVGERGVRLSGGQRQVSSLLKALILLTMCICLSHLTLLDH